MGFFARCLLLLCFSLLSACSALTPRPVDVEFEGPSSQVFDTFTRTSLYQVDFFEIKHFDDQQLHTSYLNTADNHYMKGMTIDTFLYQRKVPAGKHRVFIEAKRLLGAPMFALKDRHLAVSGWVDVELQEGEIYYVSGEIGEHYSAVWLENTSRQRVSEKLETGASPPLSKQQRFGIAAAMTGFNVIDERAGVGLQSDFPVPFMTFPLQRFDHLPYYSFEILDDLEREARRYFAKSSEKKAQLEIRLLQSEQVLAHEVLSGIKEKTLVEFEGKLSFQDNGSVVAARGFCELDEVEDAASKRSFHSQLLEVNHCALKDLFSALIAESCKQELCASWQR